jgi:hypothetical protein
VLRVEPEGGAGDLPACAARDELGIEGAAGARSGGIVAAFEEEVLAVTLSRTGSGLDFHPARDDSLGGGLLEFHEEALANCFLTAIDLAVRRNDLSFRRKGLEHLFEVLGLIGLRKAAQRFDDPFLCGLCVHKVG